MLTNHSCHNTPSVVSRHCAQNRTLERHAYPSPMLGLRYAYATEVGKMCASALFLNISGYALSGYRRFRKSLHSVVPCYPLACPFRLPLISLATNCQKSVRREVKTLTYGRACFRSGMLMQASHFSHLIAALTLALSAGS